MGKISAFFFLSKLHGMQGRFDRAFQDLEQGAAHLGSVANLRWYLGYYRHLSHLSFLSGRGSCGRQSIAAICIARAIGDELFAHRSSLDFHWMSRASGNQKTPELSEMKKFAELSESDLKHWIEALEVGTLTPKTYTLRRFLELSFNGGLNGFEPEVLPSAFPSWIYDSNLELLLDLRASQFAPLGRDSSMAKLLHYLNGSQKRVSTEEAFTHVWKLKWSPDRHQNVLDVCLTRIGKLSENLKVKRADSMLELASRGLIL
jgi:hypothetical protein